ncbi:MAG: hypothetical protein COC05_05410 [Gammaproteobacteria bacterium]|nr:MAG: hypothetical protein COC05_05410 [Gammaproteobacteria bacterium]
MDVIKKAKQNSRTMPRLLTILVLGSAPLSLHAAPLSLHAMDLHNTASPVDTGLGTEFTAAFGRTINGRLGINITDFDNVRDKDNANSLDFGLNSWSALLDWHPFSGGFRFSGGLLHNDAIERQDVDPRTGLANVNALGGKEFASLSGIIDLEGTTPYLGIGWGNALTKNGRLGLLLDFGVVLQDNAEVGLSSGFSQDFLLNGVLDDYGYLPVFSLGLSYQFD